MPAHVASGHHTQLRSRDSVLGWGSGGGGQAASFKSALRVAREAVELGNRRFKRRGTSATVKVPILLQLATRMPRSRHGDCTGTPARGYVRIWYCPNEIALYPRHASLGVFNIVYIGSREPHQHML